MVGSSLARLGLKAAAGAAGAGGWTFAEKAQRPSPAVSKFQEVVADHGSGSYVWTTDGRRHLDFACGIGVLSTGHCHPKVVEAIQRQAGQLIMAQQNLLPGSKPMVDLLQRLERVMPSQLASHFFCNSGSEAADNAIKIARSYTGRQNIIAFDGAYHGRTYGAMSLTTSKTVYRQNFGPLPSGVVSAPYPYCLHCKARHAAGGLGYEVAPNVPPLGKPYSERRCCGGPLEQLEWMLKTHSAPSETAAIIIEPILGEGGFLTPPPGFLSALRTLCDKHGMLLIFDEVQCGVARTGKWWGHQHLTENATERGQQLTEGLLRLAQKYPIIDVRGRGLMLAAEFGGVDGGLTARPHTAADITHAAAKRGMLLMGAGARETIRFLPPLNVSAAEVEEGLSIFERCLEDVFAPAPVL
ncbi:hypothetical protein COHA_004857 [Chlorella ohadii]|uniref:4-aminobutyrate aminotransferase n=1 Tax=Chlorella ohadii TaxID=2649997 RepID=A0AAD5H6V9_9CHLO|nr:hypothetical protein COHA_004857 [Chlorella ohadii]